MTLHRPFLVGTQHKAGTVYMRRIVAYVAKKLGLSTNLDSSAGITKPQAGLDIFFDNHSFFHNDFLGLPDGFDGIRIIRDPRDIIISGAHYHIKSGETWLDTQTVAETGISFRDFLASQPTWRSRYTFELLHRAKRSLSLMADFYQQDHCMRQDRLTTLRLETLTQEDGVTAFTDALEAMALPEEFVAAAGEAFVKFSRDEKSMAQDKHITSAKPGPRWPDSLDRPLGRYLAIHIQDHLQKLGYEPNNDWIDGLPDYRPALDAKIDD